MNIILNLKKDDGYEWILNFNHVLCITKAFDSGYRISFTNGSELLISYKEYDNLCKALQTVLE